MNVARGAGKRIIEQYVDTGKARYTFRHFPFLGDRSYRAAEAADCADEQGKFLEWHAKLAEVWEQSGDHLAGEKLRAYAEELSLGTTSFNSCLDSRHYEGSVLAEKEEGAVAGVQTTPTMFINDIAVQGEKSFEEYQTVIDEALGAKTPQ
jgi:protein-disulfide isomerase